MNRSIIIRTTWLGSSCTSSKSSHKPIFQCQPTPSSTPRGGPPTHGPQETPPEPNNHSKYLQKNLFPEPVFKWLTSRDTSSKSTHKLFFQHLPTVPSTSGGGSLAHEQRGPHQNQKQPKVPPKNTFFETVFKLLRSSRTSSKSAHKPTSQHLPTPSLTPGGKSHTQDPRQPHQNPNTTQNNSKKLCARFFDVTVDAREKAAV